MVKQQTQGAAVELSAEQEELAQRIYGRLRAKVDEELLAMVRMMASKPDHELFGPGEFELRDRLNGVGATIAQETANERANKGVLR
jgi:tRNA A37 N6-isopentenylltransferase MiaA